jgi:hypothetical protein
MGDLFAMPFHEYMAYRTKYAVDVAQRSKLIDMDYGFVALLQAMWAREYWFKKMEEMKGTSNV